jgi:hypothetical protein
VLLPDSELDASTGPAMGGEKRGGVSKRRLLVLTWSCFCMVVTVLRCLLQKLHPHDRLSFLSFIDVSLVSADPDG